VFLLFEEPIGGYELPTDASEYGTKLQQRRNWDVLTFGEKCGLKIVGADYFVSTAMDPGSATI